MVEYDDISSSRAAIVTILLSRNASTVRGQSTTQADSSTVKLCVISRRPNCRSHLRDPTRYILEYIVFLDDRRSFANVDALLTRLAPVGTAYVACTEGYNDAAATDRNNGGGGDTTQKKKKKTEKSSAAEVASLLRQLVDVIESRVDLAPSNNINNNNNDDDNDESGISVHFLPTMSKSVAKALAESTLLRLLGGIHDTRYLSYRGDKLIAEECMVLWTLGCFFSADISYSNNHDDDGAYSIVPGMLNSRMSLDRTAAEAIHLLPPRTSGGALLTGGNRNNNSIYGVLNVCNTRMGSRTLEVWLRQPLVDIDEIVRRQNTVSKLVENNIARDRLRNEGLSTFRGLDIDKLGHGLTANGRAANELANGRGQGVASASKALENLYKLHLIGNECLPRLLGLLKSLFGANDEVGQNVEAEETALFSTYQGLKKCALELDMAMRLAEKTIDFDAAPRDFTIQSNLDASLDDVREELNNINDELQAVHANMNELWFNISGTGRMQVILVDVDGNSKTACVWQFRLKDTNAAKLLEINGLQIHSILKNGVYFSTSELDQLGTAKKDLMAEYDEKQRIMVNNAMSIASTYVPVLERLSVLLAELDVLASFAHVAANSNNGYCRPEMTDGEEDGLGIVMKKARHPCVELQDDTNFIANDFNLVFGSSSFLLVTGPNMGGKSTYIRSLGAIITMAQIGSFVPCTSAKINIVHHILARVGAGDSQDRGISTFMAEMLEASSILRVATKRSLIIIDELGRGTSTFDGYGLAKAISEHIVQKIGCLTVFATHFHELTALEEQETSVSNSHVTACSDGRNGLTFLYEVRPGPCLESFGIQVAEMANMPASIIIDAKRKAKQLENFVTRKKKSDKGVDDEVNDANEKRAAAAAFLGEFKKLPMDTMTNEEIKRTLLLLIQKYGI